MTSLRIEHHPVLNFPERKIVNFYFEGKQYQGYEGEPVAAALHAAGIRTLRRSPQKDRARGFFCAIGRCSSCIMEIDGQINTMTCITPLAEGMHVKMQKGHGHIEP
ncbi:MAG: pyridine nucleotide-disulfide oxidoreductase [Candidatus Riflebacteria bacterium GWC2_50_8]|nr:MAG: pyridine nucleotide-disulfide oxidoreductase [Candidatus Riflebacteria bacterium GWC2_50_8]